MPDTKLLAKGNPIKVDPAQSELAQLDMSSYRSIRLSAGNWAGSLFAAAWSGRVSGTVRRSG
jgi:hypothetical protein